MIRKISFYKKLQTWRWQQAWSEKKFPFLFIISAIWSVSLFSVSPYYMAIIQSRQGIVINDIVLQYLPAKDVSFLVSNVMSFCTIISMVWLAFNPKYFLLAFMSFSIILTMRYTCMYIFSLEAPINYIRMRDPFLDSYVYGGALINKDLFFSGHTSFMFLIFLVVKHPVIKWINFIGALTVGILLLVQHTHYAMDVFAAPFFAYMGYMVSKKVYEKSIY